MSHRCTRFHIEMDLDLQMPPESEAVIRKMVREAMNTVLKSRYSRARNVKILSKKEIVYK